MTEIKDLPLEQQIDFIIEMIDLFEDSLSKANDYGSICFKMGVLKSSLLEHLFNLKQKLNEGKIEP